MIKLILCRSLLAVASAAVDRNNDEDNKLGATDYEPPHAGARTRDQHDTGVCPSGNSSVS
jgi:hypothetical protein